MARTTARATLLGAAGTILMGAAAAGLLRASRAAWPGAAPSGVEAGLEFLATGASGVVAAWLTLLLAGATASLAVSSRRPSRLPTGTAAPERVVVTGLTGRVAAALLVVASLGAAPAAAAAEARPSTVAAAGPVTEPVPAGVGSSRPNPADVMDVVDVVDAEDPPGTPASDEVPLPGWTPTVGPPDPARRTTAEVGLVSTASPGGVQQEVVVHRGDTLWTIAARHLGEHATDQDVAEEWPLWYAANRDVIGTDPDLIRPGQRLAVPTTGGAR
jgi:resuscitation-promoting factor RpfA